MHVQRIKDINKERKNYKDIDKERYKGISKGIQ